MRHVGLKLRMLVVGAILFAFYSVVALLLWLYTGSIAIVAVASLGFVAFQYKFGKWAALRSVGAEEMDPEQYPQIHQDVEHLSRQMNIEKPRLMVASMGAPNAFAVGRKGAGTVVVGEELIQLLERDELEGVLAHELAHIRNRDVVMMVIGQSIASLVGLAAQFAVLFTSDDIGDIFLAMIVGNLTQLLALVFVFAISRYREYVADSDAAEAIQSGDPLARALEKIKSANESGGPAGAMGARGGRRGRGRGGRGRRGGRGSGGGTPDEVSALCIFGGERGIMATLFSTHPPMEKRVQRLREDVY
ncbi:MAG: M48 family metallopeptidase [Halobacteriaceae archaeon]